MLNLLEPNLFRQKSAMKNSAESSSNSIFDFADFAAERKWSTCSPSCTSCAPLSCSTLGFWQCAKIPRDRIVCAYKGSCWLVTGMILVELHSMSETESIGFMVSIAKFLF